MEEKMENLEHSSIAGKRNLEAECLVTRKYTCGNCSYYK